MAGGQLAPLPTNSRIPRVLLYSKGKAIGETVEERVGIALHRVSGASVGDFREGGRNEVEQLVIERKEKKS